MPDWKEKYGEQKSEVKNYPKRNSIENVFFLLAVNRRNDCLILLRRIGRAIHFRLLTWEFNIHKNDSKKNSNNKGSSWQTPMYFRNSFHSYFLASIAARY